MTNDNNNLQSGLVTTDYGLGSETVLQIPRGHKGLVPIVFDMTDIYRIVGRITEIERVTPATFGELVTDFNKGMIQLNRLIGIVEIELKEAENTLDMAESVALLERVEDYLKIRGIKSSADTREAAMILDPDVQEARRRKSALLAISEYVKGLKEAIERAYFSAKQVAEFTAHDPYLNKYSGDKNG